MTTDNPVGFDPAEIESMLDSGQIEFKNGQPVVVGNLAGEALLNDVDTGVLYDQRTGVSSTVRIYEGNNTFARMLSKRDPETGQRIFSTKRPAIAPPTATVPCWLHPSHPDYARWHSMGLATCKGSSFASEQDVQMHMRNKHRNDWQRIESWRAEERDNEARGLQRQTAEAMLAAVQAMASAQQPQTVAETPAEAPVEPVSAPAEATEPVVYRCGKCEYTTPSEHGLKIHTGRFHQEE